MKKVIRDTKRYQTSKIGEIREMIKMIKIKCPFCEHIQNKKKLDVGSEQMAKFFNWHYVNTVSCEKCGRSFIENKNEVKNDKIH